MKAIVKNPRYQVALAILLFTFSGYYTWRELRQEPRLQEVTNLAERDRTLTRANQMARSAVGGEGLVKIRTAIERYDQQAAAVAHLLPAEADAQAILPMISAKAADYGVSITGLSPAELTPGSEYDIKSVKLEVRGRYHDVGAFLAGLAESGQIVRIRNFNAQATDEPTSDGSSRIVRAEMSLESYLAPSGNATESAVVSRGGRPGGTAPKASADSLQAKPHSTYMRDSDERLWQLVHVPGKNLPVRIPVTASGRAAALAWIAKNGGER